MFFRKSCEMSIILAKFQLFLENYVLYFVEFLGKAVLFLFFSKGDVIFPLWYLQQTKAEFVFYFLKLIKAK